MLLHDITKETENLEAAIRDGLVCPDAPFYADVWIHGNQLTIRIGDQFKKESMPEEILLFAWDYDRRAPLALRHYPVQDGTVLYTAEPSLLFQMRYLDLFAVRLGIALQTDGKYFCGYIRNPAGTDGEIAEQDQPVGKLAVYKDHSVLASWLALGVLTIRFRDTRKFDDAYYRGYLSAPVWEDGILHADVKLPLVTGVPAVKLCRTSSKEVCSAAAVTLKETGANHLHRIFKLRADLRALPADDSNGYMLLIELDGHTFRVFTQVEAEAAAPADSTSCVVSAADEADLQLHTLTDVQGRFIIKTGHVYPYMVSIVTAVYNTAPFLAEMINSVLGQDISALVKNRDTDFTADYYADIFEFILVDDGSTDDSGRICDEYAALDPRIRVIHKENGGVSSARNAGIEAASGKYITFPDSDDKLSENVFEKCLMFFEKHEDEIAMVTYPLHFFDASSAEHWTSYRFKNLHRDGTRVLNMLDDWDKPQYFTSAAFFKLANIKSKLYFNTGLINGEDIRFLHEVLFSTVPQIGLVNTCTYWYRRRSTGEQSAIQSSNKDEKYYIPYIENIMNWLLAESQKTYGYIPKYIQYTVMGQMQWRYGPNDQGETGIKTIGYDRYQEYKNLANSLLRYIDDDVILAQRKIWNEHRYYMLKHKYGTEADLVLEGDKVFFEFNGARITTPLNIIYIRFEFLWIRDGLLHIEGYSMNFDDKTELLIYVNGEPVRYDPVDRDVNKYTFDDICMFATTFTVNIPLDADTDRYEIEFHSRLEGYEVVKHDFRYAKTMPLAQSYHKSYYTADGWSVRREGNAFAVYNLRCAGGIGIDFEAEFVQQVNASKNKNALQEILALRRQALTLLAGRNPQKKIWLISDRVYAANDNGEALMRFLHKKQDPEVEAYYVIDQSAPDYERMKEFGRVVAFGSRQHHLLHLIADHIISSAGEEFVINPCYEDKNAAEVIRDLLAKTSFIFLQHGITKDDVSGWLNRYNKNITGFICAAPREAQSILDYDYYYRPENVWLTGFPRHDRLHRDEKLYITIMPTWRHWLAKYKLTNAPGDDFTESDFFLFYNRLLNEERLLDAAAQYGYTVCFMPHPSIQPVIDSFAHDPRVLFFAAEKPYHEIFAESDLVITDYSSTSMDFTLIGKPVVYCQFDKEKFFENHTYAPGYFDYETDGFGEVTYDMESLIDVIIRYMQNGCKVYEPYKSRMETFFAYHDRGNCERVYQKIKELDRKG